jgi:hypothetical protein
VAVSSRRRPLARGAFSGSARLALIRRGNAPGDWRAGGNGSNAERGPWNLSATEAALCDLYINSGVRVNVSVSVQQSNDHHSILSFTLSIFGFTNAIRHPFQIQGSPHLASKQTSRIVPPPRKTAHVIRHLWRRHQASASALCTSFLPAHS